jgi:adenosylmethionine-8-amino-7-oxononanoate aminotransferase
MVGLELVADRETRAAVPRASRLTESIVREARSRGVLVYSGTGNADGVDGDTILLGPPFVVTDDELTRIAAVVGDAVEAAVAGLRALT